MLILNLTFPFSNHTPLLLKPGTSLRLSVPWFSNFHSIISVLFPSLLSQEKLVSVQSLPCKYPKFFCYTVLLLYLYGKITPNPEQIQLSANLGCQMLLKRIKLPIRLRFASVELWTLSAIFLYFPTSVQFSSVAQSCPTLCDPKNRSTPGLPVHHQLPQATKAQLNPFSFFLSFFFLQLKNFFKVIGDSHAIVKK